MSCMSPRGGARPGAGRPKGRKFTATLYVEMEPEELEELHELAASLDETLSSFVRRTLREKRDEILAGRR